MLFVEKSEDRSLPIIWFGKWDVVLISLVYDFCEDFARIRAKMHSTSGDPAEQRLITSDDSPGLPFVKVIFFQQKQQGSLHFYTPLKFLLYLN